MISSLFWYVMVFGLVVYGLKWRLKAWGHDVSFRCLASQIINFLTFGKWDETLSGRVGQRVESGAYPVWFWQSLKTFINFFHTAEDHCADSAIRVLLRKAKGTIPFLDARPEHRHISDIVVVKSDAEPAK